MNMINIGDVVQRTTSTTGYYYPTPEIGDVIEKNGERCRVAWRDRQVKNFYRPEVMETKKGKRTWVNQKFLVLVQA